ncbi:MAG: restriction endonuclease [Propionibacteriaceae bacterium]|nr:restriction endonuclease [Propionibacteriaceae bacterium]
MMFSDAAAGVGDFLGRTLVPVLWGYAVLFGVLATLWGAARAQVGIRRLQAQRQLGVRIPAGFRVRSSRTTHSPGCFALVYPRWQLAKQDGTCNLRCLDNEVVEGFSMLEIGRWRLASRSVVGFYDFVVALRERGHVIALSDEEAEKLTRFTERDHLRGSGVSRSHIHQRFAADPAQFEQFCAELYRELGHHVEAAPSNTGCGLSVTDPEGEALVKCLCLPPSQLVEEQRLQELAEANPTPAERLIVVTTAGFTTDAEVHASQAGMVLIDGDALVTLCEQAWGNRPPAQGPSLQQVQLTLEDHLAHMPADLRDRYAAAA